MYDDLPDVALSIRQPWAWAILHAGKNVENRSWRTSRRGRIAIHASKGMTRDEYEHCLATMHGISENHPFPSGLRLPNFDDLERGGIIGEARIIDCVMTSASPWFFGEFGFLLAEVRSVPFIPVKGEQGFFKWKRSLA
ncbi:ASCH domain-containing protein [Devosia sp. 2618]|uniref:ASCH domain-containing protein n=1 Tax=Devosia sp. 2618 TaxID=3156454 RepID=UPI003391C1E5